MSSSRTIPVLAFFRVLLGIFYLVSGGSKLLAPYQNFLYVVQSYEVFTPFLEELASRLVPWVEFFLGLFLILGLWLRYVLFGYLGLIIGFLFLLEQAMWRNLPIDHCGCFGSWLPISLRTMFFIDSATGLLVILMLRRLKQTSWLSLDNYFSK